MAFKYSEGDISVPVAVEEVPIVTRTDVTEEKAPEK